MMARRPHLTFILIAVALSVNGQMGIRLTPYQYERVEKGSNAHIGAGFDLDLSRRSAMSVDYSARFDIWGVAEANVESYDFYGYFVSYSPITRTWSLTLRSLYFLNDEVSGFYIASSIGYRAVELELDPDVSATGSWVTTQPSWARRSTHNGGYTQLGFRLGTRSELDGFYGDLFLGLGLNLGDPDLDLPLYMAQSDWGIKDLYLQAGYSMGIGW
jgi:hypothetical protein